jgi:hypothetical protein
MTDQSKHLHLQGSTLFKNTGRNLSLLLILNLVIGSIVFYVMGLKHTSIGFHSDDYGFIYNGRYNSIHDVKRIFNNGDMIENAGSLYNERAPTNKPSFLETLYRPLVLLVMGTEYKFFGLNTYHYHLLHTALHTIITLALFTIIALLVHPLAGIPIALFFGLHSSLKDYFFWQCYIQNSLEACLTLLIIVFFIWWRRSKKLLPLATCLGLFFISLLLRETIIVLPLLAGLWVIAEKKAHRFQEALNTCLLFVIPTACYLFLRIWAHPFSSSINKLGIKHFQVSSPMIEIIRGKFFDLLTCFFDILGLKWLPSGSMPIKITAVAILCWFIVFTWRKNPHKNLVFLAALAIILTSWPSILLVHCSRYIYLPIAFFALFIGLLAASLTRRGLIIFCLLGTTYASLQGYITNKNLSSWVTQTNLETEFLTSLAQLSSTEEKILVLGYPLRLIGTGSLAALRLYGGHKNSIIKFALPYFDAWEQGQVGEFICFRNNTQLTIRSTTPNTLWIPTQSITADSNYLIHDRENDKIYSLSIPLQSKEFYGYQIVYWDSKNACFERI